MGPDEYHDGYPHAPGQGVRNNTYTNVLAAWVLARAGETVELLAGHDCDPLWRRLHLAHEETGPLPLVQQHMSAAEWATAEKTAQRSFALRDLAFLLPWAAAGLDRATRDRAFATAGSSFRVLYRLTRGRFERSEAAAFRRA